MVRTRALLLVGSHGLDLMTLLLVVSTFGIIGEANPVAVAVYTSFGIAGLIAFKAIGVGIMGMLSFGTKHTNSRPVIIGAYLAIGIGFLGAVTNSISFAILSGYL